MQAARDARAAKALDNQAAHKAELKARQKATDDMKASTLPLTLTLTLALTLTLDRRHEGERHIEDGP